MEHSILDDLGQEVTGRSHPYRRACDALQVQSAEARRGPSAGIVAPVTICIAITVLLVRVLNPSGASNSAVMRLATISYDEKVSMAKARSIERKHRTPLTAALPGKTDNSTGWSPH